MSLSLETFDPRKIPWQWDAVKEVCNADYSLGVHEFGFCGIVGSAKTTLCAFLALKHCTSFKNARFLIGRRSYTDLKSSCFYELKEMVYATWGEQSKDWIRKGDLSITFPWGAEIIGRTWGDGKYESKFKSLNLSGAWLEEPTENSYHEYNEMMSYLRPRLSRVNSNNSDVTENFLLASFNAHDPDHPIYKDFYETKSERVHLIESLKRDNPFLHDKYYDDLLERLDPVEARRQVFGEWVSKKGEVIYYAYDRDIHFKSQKIKPVKEEPLLLSFDFNIADGKPMSCIVAQEINGVYKFIDEVIIHGSRTLDICEELEARGYVYCCDKILIYGDATGSHRDTRSTASDYDIIRRFFSNREMKVNFEMHIPTINPPIKERHNAVNGKLMNANGKSSIEVYGCEVLAEGLKKTKFKKGTSIEDDNNRYQHVTTCVGYMISAREKKKLLSNTPRFIKR